MSASSRKQRDQFPDNIIQDPSVQNDHQWGYELPQEEDAFIPMDQWSNVPEIDKKQKNIVDNRIENKIETTADESKIVKKCPNCGKEIKTNAAECGYCGRSVYQQTGKKVFL